MRTEAAIYDMRELLHRQAYAGHVSAPVLTTLDWVVSTLVPDLDLLAAADTDDDNDEYEPRLEELVVALTDAVAPSTLPATLESLSRMAPAPLAELGAVARKLDRLCKAEAKKRTKALGGTDG
jgi:hypothetical protein